MGILIDLHDVHENDPVVGKMKAPTHCGSTTVDYEYQAEQFVLEAAQDYPQGLMDTIYRSPAVVPDDPCGSCVHDVTRPTERVGYPDPVSPMMMRCDVCGEQWIDPTLAQQTREAQRRLDEMSKQAKVMQQLAERMIEDAFYKRRSVRVQIALAFVSGYVLLDRFVRIVFP